MRAPRGGPVVARPSMHALRLSTICGKGPTPLPSARGDENSRGISVDPLSKGFWLSRPWIRSSRSCWWVGMDVRFVCVIRVPVSRVNVNTTDATTGATALDHSCVSRLPFVYQNGNDHEAARTHSLDSCEPFFLSRIARSSLSSGAALWENHFSESLRQPIHGRGATC